MEGKALKSKLGILHGKAKIISWNYSLTCLQEIIIKCPRLIHKCN